MPDEIEVVIQRRRNLLPGEDEIKLFSSLVRDIRLTDARNGRRITNLAIRNDRDFKTSEAKRHTLAD